MVSAKLFERTTMDQAQMVGGGFVVEPVKESLMLKSVYYRWWVNILSKPDGIKEKQRKGNFKEIRVLRSVTTYPN